MLRIVPIFGGLLTAIAFTSVFAQPTSAGDGATPSECEVRPAADLERDEGQRPEPDDYLYRRWLTGATAQRGVEEVDTAIRGAFGGDDVDRRLAAGLIGVVPDHDRQEIRVVIDPSVADTDQLNTRLSVAKSSIPVRVAPACRSAAEVRDALAEVESGRWQSPTEAAIGYVFYVDAATSAVVVEIPEKAVLSRRGLASLGPAVRLVDAPEFVRESRSVDVDPHKGGAGIRRATQTFNTCTSGFTAKMPGGNKGSVTAGHCYGNGLTIRSGTTAYGVTAGRSNFPTYDMVRIQPNGENFHRKIWANPGSPSVRDVTSAGNPSGGETGLCVSGMVSLQECGADIINLNATACDSFGCTPNLAKARWPGGNSPTFGGDSGAPVYKRSGNNAHIRGMNVGSNGASTYLHKVNQLKDHLGITKIAQA